MALFIPRPASLAAAALIAAVFTGAAPRAQAAAAVQPLASVRYQIDDQLYPLTAAPGGTWQLPSDAPDGPVQRIVVKLRPGHPGNVTLEASSETVMRCGEVVLADWPGGTSRPWKLSRRGTRERPDPDFEIPRRLMDADVPNFPAHGTDDLRRALARAQGHTGMASEAQAATCRRWVTAERFDVLYDGQQVQSLTVNLREARPLNTQTDGCAGEFPMPALHAANDLGYEAFRHGGFDGGFASCKPLPDEPGKLLIALAYPHANEPLTDDGGSFDLVVQIAEQGSGRVLAQWREDDALVSDAVRLTDIAVDTGRYQLAPGVRAFGVRVSHQSSSRVFAYGEETLALFRVQQGRIEPLLRGLKMAESHGEWNNCEGTGAETRGTLGLARGSSHGLADLVLTSVTTGTRLKRQGDDCVETPSRPRRTRATLRFDGQRYRGPATLPLE